MKMKSFEAAIILSGKLCRHKSFHSLLSVTENFLFETVKTTSVQILTPRLTFKNVKENRQVSKKSLFLSDADVINESVLFNASAWIAVDSVTAVVVARFVAVTRRAGLGGVISFLVADSHVTRIVSPASIAVPSKIF